MRGTGKNADKKKEGRGGREMIREEKWQEEEDHEEKKEKEGK